MLYSANMNSPSEQEYYSSIARQVINRRAELGLSQKDLAELCGTTQPAIARFESGKRPPRIDTLLAMAEALDSTLDVNFRPRTRPRSFTQ